jgi:hypothetical protein
MPKIKKIWVIIISIVLFLIITNPGLKGFKESGKDGTRKYNFLLFSIFEEPVPGYPPIGGRIPIGHPELLPRDASTNYYLGIVLNFFKITEE